MLVEIDRSDKTFRHFQWLTGGFLDRLFVETSPYTFLVQEVNTPWLVRVPFDNVPDTPDDYYMRYRLSAYYKYCIWEQYLDEIRRWENTGKISHLYSAVGLWDEATRDVDIVPRQLTTITQLQ